MTTPPWPVVVGKAKGLRVNLGLSHIPGVYCGFVLSEDSDKWFRVLAQVKRLKNTDTVKVVLRPEKKLTSIEMLVMTACNLKMRFKWVGPKEVQTALYDL